jgi:uncharacterized membrane protein YphA (DoxX/SURF4 family)
LFSLRVGLGIVWLANLSYVVDPANDFFPTFAATASSFGPTTPTGPALAEFVAANAALFALAVALVTAYLALAFLLGFSVRIACLVGTVFNLALLLTQFTTVSTMPGGTDVGPHPVYLVAYVALFVANGARLWSLDGWLEHRARRAGRTGRQAEGGASVRLPSAVGSDVAERRSVPAEA